MTQQLVRPSRTPGRAARLLGQFTSAERRSLARCLAFVALLHVIGWGTLVLGVAPHGYAVGGSVLGVGLGVTAYTLGMRHAFDIDHIACIDNTTRKLLGEGTRPVSTGFWFSLGHSSVVFVMVAGIGLGIRALSSGVSDPASSLRQASGVWGTSVSGVFLILIGLINLSALIGVLRVFATMRRGEYDEAELERQLDSRGFMNRILGRVTKLVTKPWHLYPTGFLFGLGFDTVTEIGLLVIAGGAVAANLPFWAVLTLPILFAAGMSLLDTLDGAFMTVAYGWALARPVRKVYYNITVTALSVAVALIIGGVEIGGLVAEKLGAETGLLGALRNVDLAYVGYGVVALFLITWALSVAIWKFGRIEDRWSARLTPTDPR